MGKLSETATGFFRISPAERALQKGAFSVRRGEAQKRLDVNYNALNPIVEKRLLAARFKVVAISEIERQLQYGCSQRAEREPKGTPIIRMSNMQPDGWNFSDLKYVDLSHTELSTWTLDKGDILFNRTNSKELVGKCEVFEENGVWVFASYLMRLKIDQSIALPEFITAYLNGPSGRAQIGRDSRQILGMTNINAEEIRDLRIPLPSLPEQHVLVAELLKARSYRNSEFEIADNRLAELDNFILDELQLVLPPSYDPIRPFAVCRSALLNRRMDPQSHTPLGIPSNPRGIPFLEIREVLAPPNLTPSLDVETALVPYVGLPECDLHEVREIAFREREAVHGRAIAIQGDILFARIEPSIFNRKYVFADDLGPLGWAFLSTEFFPLRAKGSPSDQRYLYAILLSEIVQRQVKGKTTGTSGRRRLDRSHFESILIPWPEKDVRARIAAKIDGQRTEAKKIRSNARSLWNTARQAFEDALLGPDGMETKQ